MDFPELAGGTARSKSAHVVCESRAWYAQSVDQEAAKSAVPLAKQDSLIVRRGGNFENGGTKTRRFGLRFWVLSNSGVSMAAT